MVDVSTDPGRLAAVDTEGMGLEPVLSESTPVDLLTLWLRTLAFSGRFPWHRGSDRRRRLAPTELTASF